MLLEQIIYFSHQVNTLQFSLAIIVAVTGATSILAISKYLCHGPLFTHRINVMVSFLLEIFTYPLIGLSLVYLLYFMGIAISVYWFPPHHSQLFLKYQYIITIVEVFIYCWLILNVLQISKLRILHFLLQRNYNLTHDIISAVGMSIQAAIILMMINMAIPQLSVTGIPLQFLTSVSRVMLILVLSWMTIKTINVIATVIENQYIIPNSTTFDSRKIKTQLVIVKRLVIGLTLLVTIAFILCLFDSVKSIGTGILTTAGIISAIGAFASQQSLGRIFAGILIAFTQPIRIGDTVIIDNEFGEVEEITLSYIVIKLWDLRRLILPTDYFTHNGLQNLTRSSSELLGTIFFRTDYALPVETVREKFLDLVKASELWDMKVATFQVTEITHNGMEIRALVSAQNSTQLWNLRCEIREKLINYIVTHYPACLSKPRS